MTQTDVKARFQAYPNRDLNAHPNPFALSLSKGLRGLRQAQSERECDRSHDRIRQASLGSPP